MRSLARAFRAAFSLEPRALERQLALLCLVLAILLRLWDPAPIQTLRLKTFDFYQWLNPWDAPAARLVTIVDIDDESLAAIGQWPWPRTLLADLVGNLAAAGAVAVGFDVLFPEPDRLSAPSLAQALRNLDPQVERFLRELPSSDEIFARRLAGAKVVLGQSGMQRAQPNQEADLKTTSVAEVGDDPRPYLLHYPGLVRNLPILEQAAAGLGMITLNPEPDGIARRVPAVIRVGETMFPTLAIELLRVATGQTTVTVKTNEAGIRGIVLQGIEIPTDPHGRLWVHYAPHDRARYVSAKDVLAGTAPVERLQGKIVLVGTSALGLQDIKATPLASAMPGVEVHALLLENILARHLLARPNNAIGAELVVIVLVSTLLIVFVPKWGPIRTLMVGLVGAGLYAAAVSYLFLEKALLYDLTFPMLATFAVYIVLAYLNYIREEAQKRQIRTAFSHYMSPALVEELAGHPEKLKLGGEMKELTLLFCDIRGFTTISEQHDAAGLTRVINRFLTPMTAIILDHQGTIDKYIGDCIMAFWNAPLDDPDHVRHACSAALRMVEDLKELNRTWGREAEAEGAPFTPIRIGIGINSGTCAVGNMGSDQRFDYSVLGDDVNLASRLEGQTKEYAVDIIIGERTQAKAEDYACLELDLIRVKGKTMPARVFALLGDAAAALDSDFRALAARHADFLAAYRAQEWGRSERLLAECQELAAASLAAGRLDPLYDLYRARIAEFRSAPPEPGWDGVYSARVK